MAAASHVKLKSKWKNLKINPDLLSDPSFESLISCKILTDYELIDSHKFDNRKYEKKVPHGFPEQMPTHSKAKKKIKANTLDAEYDSVVNPHASDVKSIVKLSKQKKKRKKKKNINPTEGTKIDVTPATLFVSKKEDLKRELHLEKQGKKHAKSGMNVIDVSSKLLGENVDKKKETKTSKSESVQKETEDVALKYTFEKEEHDQKQGRKRKKCLDINCDETGRMKKQKINEIKESEIEQDSIPNEKTLSEDMLAWKNLFVPKPVLQALHRNGFMSPTPIQAMALPSAIRDHKDIVGAAETGSGKTLAFGIPVLHNILLHKERQNSKENDTEDVDNESDVSGADDSVSEDEDVSLSEDEEDVSGEEIYEVDDEEEIESEDDIDDGESNIEIDGIGCVKVIDNADFSDLGIPSVSDSQKMTPKSPKRKIPLALILQPTRELAIQVKNHLQTAAKYTDIKIAPIVGGMSVEKQKRILSRCPDVLVATPGRLWELMQQDTSYLSHIDEIQSLVVDEADRMIEKGHFEELSQILGHINSDDKNRRKRQTFVFSATLTMVHPGPQRNIRKKVTITEEKKLELLMNRIKMKEKPKVIDLTRKIGTVETLTEARINCNLDEKDLYLYYFITQYPGRTLVFANSKDCIRRLMSIFTLLKTKPLPLHADMHQKQRLKNLERFTANDEAILLASDVAARGLDIPNVEHVIHYQVPQTVENYVHRSGRTARAMKEGLSVMIIGPEDIKNYRKIIHALNRNEDLPLFPVEYQLMATLKKRLNLACKIDTTEHRFNKKKRQNEWFEKAAREMDMLVDEDDLLNDLGDSSMRSDFKNDLKKMKNELEELLMKRLAPHSFSGKYPTQSGKLVVHGQKDDSSAIKLVRRDKKLQQKLIESDMSRSNVFVEKKKSKWKKKK